jgi:hypothetical protein
MAQICNGSSTYIDLGNSSALAPPALSFFCWIKAAALTNAYSGLIYRNDGTNFYQIFLKSTGNLAYYFSGSGGSVDPGTAVLSTGKWYHVGFVMPGTAVSGFAYINGVADSPALGTGPLSSGNTGHTVLGNDTVNAGRVFAGSIAHAVAYNIALSASDIVLLASGISPLAIKAANIAGYWPLLGSLGALDLGPNGLLAKLLGTSADDGPPGLVPYQPRILSNNSLPTLNPNSYVPFGEWEMPAVFPITVAPVIPKGATLPFMGVG